MFFYREQELSNYLKEKKWKKALGLAILLDKPFKCYQIIKEILEQNDSTYSIEKGRIDLEKTLLKLRDDQISKFNQTSFFSYFYNNIIFFNLKKQY